MIPIWSQEQTQEEIEALKQRLAAIESWIDSRESYELEQRELGND